jgi:hypothetical protein
MLQGDADQLESEAAGSKGSAAGGMMPSLAAYIRHARRLALREL